MFFSEDRDELRGLYAEAWRKADAGEPLTPLQAEIAAVVGDHPEYREALSDSRIERDFLPATGQTNPFLHMGLHLALRDQIKTDRPPGIRALHDKIRTRCADPHDAEHRMIECLAETLWEAQGQNALPDEQKYLVRLNNLLR